MVPDADPPADVAVANFSRSMPQREGGDDANAVRRCTVPILRAAVPEDAGVVPIEQHRARGRENSGRQWTQEAEASWAPMAIPCS